MIGNVFFIAQKLSQKLSIDHMVGERYATPHRPRDGFTFGLGPSMARGGGIEPSQLRKRSSPKSHK
jgi:hypothetical protein